MGPRNRRRSATADPGQRRNSIAANASMNSKVTKDAFWGDAGASGRTFETQLGASWAKHAAKHPLKHLCMFIGLAANDSVTGTVN